MAFTLHDSGRVSGRVIVPLHSPAQPLATLPAALRRRDIISLSVLIIIVLPYISAMQFAGRFVLFYWTLAFLTFMLPCIVVGKWLVRQAPARVPVYQWMTRLLDARWRSFLLFLVWWIAVLATLAVLGIFLSLLQSFFPLIFKQFWVTCLAFLSLLIVSTLLLALPTHYLRNIICFLALCYLAFFALLGTAGLIWTLHGGPIATPMPRSLVDALPVTFSWHLFGLALFSLLGLNVIFFMDGELGIKAINRRSSISSFLWWGGMLTFFVFLIGTLALQVIEPFGLAVTRDSPFLAIERVWGPAVGDLARVLLLLSYLGVIMAYLLIFSRAQMLAARQGYLPRQLAQVNARGVPLWGLLVQSLMVIVGGTLLFIIGPIILRGLLTPDMFADLLVSDPFCLLISIASALWAALTALMFLFALWIFRRKRRRIKQTSWERHVLPWLCLIGSITSAICFSAPLMQAWPSLFLSDGRWFLAVLSGIVCSLVLAWLVSELPRRSVLLCEQKRLLVCEKDLRRELQQAYVVQQGAYQRERDLHTRLREAYDKQQVFILQQKLLMDELKRLYCEQERAAITDPVTGLPNHRAFVQQIDEEIMRCQNDLRDFLVLFIDLDHFKDINDTWGHLAGDAVLCELAQRLRAFLRSGDFVSRYGGEEFALIMADATIAEANEAAERLCWMIKSRPFEWCCAGEQMAAISVTASIGVAAYGVHGRQREDLIEKADTAMYQAKLEGRNRARVADPLGMVSDNMLNRRLFRCQRRHAERLVKDDQGQMLVSAQTLRALSAVIHVRDHTTGAHSQRLSRLAEETGRRLDASCRDLFLMRLGGLLHDIGKISVPNEILNKPGPLDEHEWEVMRLHPLVGARLLEEIGDVFQQLAPIVLTHHECWDGSGYPRGLCRQAIPFPARVLSVVDAYDAMISRRPYKEPLTLDRARIELRRNAGTQFDPAVVEAFLNVLDTISAASNDVDLAQQPSCLVYKSRTLFESTAW